MGGKKQGDREGKKGIRKTGREEELKIQKFRKKSTKQEKLRKKFVKIETPANEMKHKKSRKYN